MKSLRYLLPLLALAAVAVAPAALAATPTGTPVGPSRTRSVAVTTTLRPVALRLPTRASQPFTVRDRASGVGIQVAASGLLDVAGSRTAGRVSFDAVTPSGAHLAFALRPDGIEDTFTLPQPVSPRRVYDVRLSHVAGLRLVESSLEFLAADGTPRLRMSPPVVIGADGTRTLASVSVTGCAVDTNPAAPWGRTPTPPGSTRCAVIVRWPGSLRYPLTVDPAWTSTASMMEPRIGQRMSLLAGGRVLVTGGGQASPRDTEIFDPATETWAATGPTKYNYTLHEQVTLDDNRVLVVGGRDGQYGKLFEDLYAPKAGTWSSPDLVVPAHGGPAVKLSDGTVLVIGGCPDNVINGFCPVSGTTRVVLRFHPDTNPPQWQPVAQLPESRWAAADGAALLPDGRVLLAGGGNEKYMDGSGNSLPEPTEIYDPGADAWSFGPALPHMRSFHHLITLGDGRLVVAGGSEGYFFNQPGVASVFVADPLATSWAELPATGRSAPALVAMGDHDLVTLGGLIDLDNQNAPVSELLDADSATWTPLDSPAGNRVLARGIRLGDGRALVTGGYRLQGSKMVTVATVELLDLGATGSGDAGPDAGLDAGADAGAGALTCGAGTVQRNGQCVAASGANKTSGCGCRAAGHDGREGGAELLLFAVAFGLSARRRRR